MRVRQELEVLCVSVGPQMEICASIAITQRRLQSRVDMSVLQVLVLPSIHKSTHLITPLNRTNLSSIVQSDSHKCHTD